MSAPLEPVTTTSSSVTPFYGGGIVQQSQSAAANATDVAASTTTAISVPGGSGVRTSTAAASGGNVVALETTKTEEAEHSEITFVDKDPRPKLMYYLACINTVFVGFFSMCLDILEVDSYEEIQCVIDYKNYRRLTTKQCDYVLLLAHALPPKLFINKCIFENAEKCIGWSNQFYKLKEVEKSLAIQNQIMFRGEKRHVSKIMYYAPTYLEENYYKPMRQLEHRLRTIKKGQHLKTSSENYKVHLFLSLLFPFWVIVWTAMCVYESTPDNERQNETGP